MSIFKQKNPFHPGFSKYMIEKDIKKTGWEALKPENCPPIEAFDTRKEAEIALKNKEAKNK